jgi:hypothetical protein
LNLQEKVEVLVNQIRSQIDLFSRRRRRDKRKAFALQVATVVASASITVLLGLGKADEQGLRQEVALILGALITVLSAFEAFFNHRHLWIVRTETVRRLERLRRKLDFYLAGLASTDLNESAIDSFRRELDEILEEDQQKWLHMRLVESISTAQSGELPASSGAPGNVNNRSP